MKRLAGRVAFVTGAARGQGRAHCVRLAREGADIIALDICGPVETSKIASATPDDLRITQELVAAEGVQMHAGIADVRRLDEVQRLVDEGVSRLGRLDVAIANAGIGTCGRTWELTELQWQTMIDVNLTGVWHSLRVAVPHMIQAGNGGSIVLTSSVGGYRGIPYESHYSAAKHGLSGLCRSLAVEVGVFNIRVNSIHPNGVNTEMVREPDLVPLLAADPRSAQTLVGAMEDGFQEPEDVAGVVAFLASDEARYITGSMIMISGGNQLM